VVGNTGGVNYQAALAVNFAVAHGAKVINFSWFYTESPYFITSDPLYQAIQEAANSGVVVVAAVGNSSQDLGANPVYPAAFGLPKELTQNYLVNLV
jgi:subtilisin family serine protease